MSADGRRHVVAIGGGSFVVDERQQLRLGALVRYALELTGVASPKVTFVTTAVGDAAEYIARLYAAFAPVSTVSHLTLYPWPNVADLRKHMLGQDLIYVTGGNTANLLALWRLHGVDEALREAWEAGVVLSGQSAGGLCWHTGGTTDSFGPDLRALPDGLGLVPYSHCPHYNAEAQRRPLYQRLVGEGTLPAGYAADEGAALHYVDTTLERVVATGDGGAAYWVERDSHGTGVTEARLEPEPLS